MLEIKLGQPFPYEAYITPYDNVVPHITPDGFAVIMTIGDLTLAEYKAITNDEFEIRIFKYLGVPHVILKFGEAFTFDFAINLTLVKSIPMREWFASENKTVAIYLLEPGTGAVKSVRFFEFTLMIQLKVLLANEFGLNPAEIPARIQMAENRFSPMDMYDQATYGDIVPKVIANL